MKRWWAGQDSRPSGVTRMPQTFQTSISRDFSILMARAKMTHWIYWLTVMAFKNQLAKSKFLAFTSDPCKVNRSYNARSKKWKSKRCHRLRKELKSAREARSSVKWTCSFRMMLTQYRKAVRERLIYHTWTHRIKKTSSVKSLLTTAVKKVCATFYRHLQLQLARKH